MLRLQLVDNPALQYRLGLLRSRSTPRWLFRQLLEEAGLLLGYEVARSLPTRRTLVETPLGNAEAIEPRDDEAVVVAVLRAALPMAWGVLRALPRAQLGLVAARRLEHEAPEQQGGEPPRFPVETGYQRLPPLQDRSLILVDPMLATASTMEALLPGLLGQKPSRVIIVTLIASKPGLDRLQALLEQLGAAADLYTAAVDPRLDSRGFIVPGLGDAGDRALGEPAP